MAATLFFGGGLESAISLVDVRFTQKQSKRICKQKMQFIGIAVREAKFLNHASVSFGLEVLETDLQQRNKGRVCPDKEGPRAWVKLAFILF